MANSLTKAAEVAFEEFVEGYEAACVLSKEVQTRYPDQTAMQRAGDTEYLPQDFGAVLQTGLDISGGADDDVVDRMVPLTYRTPDNVRYALDSKELRDDRLMREKGKAAANRLAAEVETNMAATIAARAGIVIKKVGAFNWTDGAAAEAQLLLRGANNGVNKKLFINPIDYLAVSADLGNKAYMGDLSKAAYERSQIPNIAGFRTFRTDQVSNVTVTGTVTSTLVNGANQKLTVAAMSGDTIQDNRQMTLNCDGVNVANVKAGDAFTLPNVFAVHQVSKANTGQLMTFRVLANAAGALTITPAIIVDGQYQNVTAAPADNAALTFLNTATAPANIFWTEDACVLSYGRLEFPTDGGAKVMTARTSQGVPLVMSYAFDHLKGKTTFRFTTMYGCTVLQPEKCGIILANQA
jgi:hypothetical protein